jgi:hypothetical protein
MQRLYLVSNKRFKKKYDMLAIYLGDGQVFEFKLNEWEVRRNDDWVEITKEDDSRMECFYVANIMRVSGYKSTVKIVKTDTTPLKPVA